MAGKHPVHQERGPVAVEDMKNRLAAGWTVGDLWERYRVAAAGDGFDYEYAESLPSKAETCTATVTSS